MDGNAGALSQCVDGTDPALAWPNRAIQPLGASASCQSWIACLATTPPVMNGSSRTNSSAAARDVKIASAPCRGEP